MEGGEGMFWRLGLLGVQRNVHRSLMGIISMAMAAGFMAFALSFSRGVPTGFYAETSAMIGGEIVLYAPSFDGSSALDAAGWEYHLYSDFSNTDMDTFYPEFAQNGFVTFQPYEKGFSGSEVRELSNIPYVSAVYPRYQMPAWSLTETGLRQTPVRGRDETLDALLRVHPEELIVAGRWFAASDKGRPVAVVSAQQHYAAGEEPAQVGDTITVKIPTARTYQDKNVYEYSTEHTFELEVVGIIEVPTRELAWEGYEGATKVWYFWDMMWLLDDIQVPLSTWEAMWESISQDEYIPEQLSLVIEDTTALEDIAAEIRVRSPERTVVSIAGLMRKAERELLLEDPTLFAEYALKAGSDNLVAEADVQQGVAQDLRLPLVVIIFANAGLIVSANLLLMVQERRKEIGVLKSVGALRRDIVCMVLSEALCIALCGAALGFTFFKLPASANQISSGVHIAAVVWSFVQDLILALGVAATVALLFGTIPAWVSSAEKPQSLLQS